MCEAKKITYLPVKLVLRGAEDCCGWQCIVKDAILQLNNRDVAQK